MVRHVVRKIRETGRERKGGGEGTGRDGKMKGGDLCGRRRGGFPIAGPSIWIAEDGAGGGREYRVREVRGARRRREKCDNPGNMTG